jgi:hypothetical protein
MRIITIERWVKANTYVQLHIPLVTPAESRRIHLDILNQTF